jgi:hypothetical protein
MNVLKLSVPLLAWAGALYGGLQLNRIELGHTICGPWGCGPPSSALLALHSFWFVCLLPVPFVITKLFPQSDWRRFGFGIVTIAIVAIIGIGIYDYFHFQKDILKPVYAWQRFLFRIATLPDFPIVQLGVTGWIMSQLGRRELFVESIESPQVAATSDE